MLPSDFLLEPLRTGRRFHAWNVVTAWFVAVVAIWSLAIVVGHTIPVKNHSLPRPAVAVLSTWDGSHFAQLAREGYPAGGGVAERLHAHFPLLPLVAALAGGWWGNATLAGLLISQVALLGSMLLLARLAHGNRWAPLRLQPGFWLLLTPLGFFFLVFYSESIFLFCVLLMVTTYRAERFASSWVSGVLVGLARPTSVTVPVLFVLEVVARFRGRRRWFVPALAATAPLVGLGLWFAYVGSRLHDPFGYFALQQRWWAHRWMFPFQPFVTDELKWWSRLSMGVFPLRDQIVRHASTFCVLGLLAWGRRRLEPGFFAYCVVSMLFIHMQPPISTARFELALFPLYLLIPLVMISRPRIAPIIMLGLIVIEVRFAIDHLTVRWVA